MKYCGMLGVHCKARDSDIASFVRKSCTVKAMKLAKQALIAT
jgi:hypothetical protein